MKLMKYISLIIFLFFISCKRSTKEIIIIVSGKDSIKIETNGHYNLTHLSSPCGGHGHNDTLTGIFTLTFIPCDDITVNYLTGYTGGKSIKNDGTVLLVGHQYEICSIMIDAANPFKDLGKSTVVIAAIKGGYVKYFHSYDYKNSNPLYFTRSCEEFINSINRCK